MFIQKDTKVPQIRIIPMDKGIGSGAKMKL